jgi:hypothetical protein
VDSIFTETTYALVPTNGRPCFKDCLVSLQDQVADVLVVEGGPEAQLMNWTDLPIIREPELNISKWWNLGLKLIESWARGSNLKRWNVVIVNDDVVLPKQWVFMVSHAMRRHGVAAACSGGYGVTPTVHKEPGPVPLQTRMQGFAFILAGEKGVRANEQLKWYFSDDHVDWMARKAGGMVQIPGYHVRHLYPNGQMTPELHAQTAEDAAAFHAYWGMRPW